MEPEWISLNEFMRRNKMGYDTALKMLNEEKVEFQKIGKQYKIKVSKNEQINKENEALIRENEQLKAYLRTFKNMVNQVDV